jgi:hypothetical protein
MDRIYARLLHFASVIVVCYDQTNKLFLHIKPGTLGSNLGAGLLIK